MSKSIRVSDELMCAAEKEGAVTHRSASAQIEYWAALGRRLETMGMTKEDIRNFMTMDEYVDGDAALRVFKRPFQYDVLRKFMMGRCLLNLFFSSRRRKPNSL